MPRVNFIKMDIEGAERNALRGAEATLRHFRPMLVIATENLADDIEVIPSAVHGLKLGYQQKNGGCRIIQYPFTMRPEAVCFY